MPDMNRHVTCNPLPFMLCLVLAAELPIVLLQVPQLLHDASHKGPERLTYELDRSVSIGV